MKLFGTDGIRGRAGEFPLDRATVRRLGETLGRLLAGTAARRVVLGGDTRESTPELIAELDAGLSASGCPTAFAGTLTTPGVAEVVLGTQAAAGISVSASHNPFQDNGIKIFGADGRKLADGEEERIEGELLAGGERDGGTGGRGDGGEDAGTRGRGDAGIPEVDPRLSELYLARLAEHVPVRLNNIDIVVDAGNGAAYRLGPEALGRAGARPRPIHDAPDGCNINEGCGALHPEGMARVTRESGAAMGVAFDGDADRAIFADETGRVLDGDDILWIIATDWKRKGILAAGGVVGTIMSNFGLEAALEREGIPFRRAAVGDRSVALMMDESGAKLGGETSGHVLLPFSPAGDGIQTALLVAAIAAESGAPLSRLATLEKVPQTLRNVRVARRAPLEEIDSIARAVESARAKLDHRGRVFLRYSGTEPLLRILVEGRDGGEVLRIADDLEAAVRAELE
jgi:phosphoglucosamine mutase